MTTVLLCSSDANKWQQARERYREAKHWVVGLPVEEGLALARTLDWLNEDDVDQTFLSLEGIHRTTSLVGTLYWVQLSSQAFYRELALKADVIVLDTPEALSKLRSFAHRGTRFFGLGDETVLPPFMTRDEAGLPLLKGSREPEHKPTVNRVAVIGAGIAGSLMAWRLAKEGLHVEVFDAAEVPGARASALYCGLIHPHWQRADNPLFKLTRLGFELALPLLNAFPQCFVPCGVMDLATGEEEYAMWRSHYDRSLPFATEASFARLLNKDEASGQVGFPVSLGGWFYERAGLVNAGRLCRELIASAGVKVTPTLEVKPVRTESGWQVRHGNASLGEFDAVVLCTATQTADILGLTPEMLGLTRLAGRISLLSRPPLAGLPQHVALTGRGYFVKSDEDFVAIGATYETDESPLSAEAAEQHNLALLAALFPDVDVSPLATRCFYQGVRAVCKDRLPLVGNMFSATELQAATFRGVPELDRIPVEEGLWLCTAFGSRGLTWGAACVEAVVASLTGAPSPLTKSLMKSLHPARFIREHLSEKRH